jgi:large subunit ribosomal protein L33
MLPFKF